MFTRETDIVERWAESGPLAMRYMKPYFLFVSGSQHGVIHPQGVNGGDSVGEKYDEICSTISVQIKRFSRELCANKTEANVAHSSYRTALTPSPYKPAIVM